MSTSGVKGIDLTKGIDYRGAKVAIVHTEWNSEIIDALVKGTREELERLGATVTNTYVVPGAFELPFACSTIQSRCVDVDAIIAIGCLIKGETMHFEYICDSVSKGLMDLNIKARIPVIFGVLTCLNENQAMSRAGLLPGSHNHGIDWAQAAVKMTQLNKTI